MKVFYDRISDTNDMTTNEFYVLKYILNNTSSIVDMSIQQLAEEVNLSTTTIVRLCKKLNFSGFTEMKYVLREYLKNQKNISNNETDIFKKTNQMCSDIENTSLLLRVEDISKIVDIINGDKKLHLFAGGLSMIAINYFEKLLFSIGREKTYKYLTPRLATHVTESFTENDVLFVISTHVNYEPVIKLVKLAKLKNAIVVAITPYIKNEIADLATINLRFFVEFKENNGTDITSRLPIFYLIKTIFSAVLYETGRGTLNVGNV